MSAKETLLGIEELDDEEDVDADATVQQSSSSKPVYVESSSNDTSASLGRYVGSFFFGNET